MRKCAIRRKDVAIASSAKGVVEVALNQYIDAPLADGVNAVVTSDFDEPDSGLSISILSKQRHRSRSSISGIAMRAKEQRQVIVDASGIHREADDNLGVQAARLISGVIEGEAVVARTDVVGRQKLVAATIGGGEARGDLSP